jgi:hypothetical protein
MLPLGFVGKVADGRGAPEVLGAHKLRWNGGHDALTPLYSSLWCGPACHMATADPKEDVGLRTGSGRLLGLSTLKEGVFGALTHSKGAPTPRPRNGSGQINRRRCELRLIAHKLPRLPAAASSRSLGVGRISSTARGLR